MKISRLPISIFRDLESKEAETLDSNDSKLQTVTDAPMSPAEELKSCICSKLAAVASHTTWAHRHSHDNGNNNKKQQQQQQQVSAIHTTGQLLQMSPFALLRALDPLLTLGECQQLLRRVGQHCSAKPQSALALLPLHHHHSSTHTAKDTSLFEDIHSNFMYRHISSGMKSLDTCLRGGFPIGSITEIVGNAGVGKTQLAMQLCFQAASLGQGSIYIDTERKMSLPRLEQIVREKTNNLQNDEIELNNGHVTLPSPQQVLSNVVVHSPATMNQLMSVMNQLEEDIAFSMVSMQECNPDEPETDTTFMESSLLQPQQHISSSRYPTRLIILDSIAALALREYSVDDAPQRVAHLFHIVQTLKRLSSQWKLAVVVINQVTGSSFSSMEPTAGTSSSSSSNSSHHVHAALGSSWHHCVTTRLVLEYDHPVYPNNSRLEGNNHEGDIQKGNYNNNNIEVGCIRKVTVVKSNVAPYSSMFFEIQSSGLYEWR